MSGFWSSKKRFYELASIRHPYVGNQPEWFWLEDAERIGGPMSGMWVVRSSDVPSHAAPRLGPLTWYQALTVSFHMRHHGGTPVIWRAIDSDVLQLQGHIYSIGGKICFEWTDSKDILRSAERSFRRSGPLESRIILSSLLDAEPYEYIIGMMDRFPAAVMEVGVLSCHMGWRGWNLVVWEIREY